MADPFPTNEDVDEAEFIDSFPDEDFLDDDPETPDEFGITWKFDFSKGDVYTDDSGRMVVLSDEQTVHEWIGHTLNIERWETPIYGGDIGTEINDIIGRQGTFDPQASALVEQEIKETILVHDRIEAVETVAVVPLDYDLFVYIRLTTDSGARLEEVVNF